MVPPNWDHPKEQMRDGRTDYRPMYSRRFDDDVAEWKDGYAKWEAGLRPGKNGWQPKAEWDFADIYADSPNQEWWEYHGLPPVDRNMYRPWTDDEATWYQVWETVSEGTPVTPPFPTKAGLVDYLVANGDFWDQKRREDKARGRFVGMNCDPWGREQAEAFVNSGWAPSLVVTTTGDGVRTIKEPKDGM